MTVVCEAEAMTLGMRRFIPSDGLVRCYFDGCTPLLCWRGKSDRVLLLGRLDPPFRVHEHDGTVTEETYCWCSKNELGIRRQFLVPGDASLFRSFMATMERDAAAVTPSSIGGGDG